MVSTPRRSWLLAAAFSAAACGQPAQDTSRSAPNPADASASTPAPVSSASERDLSTLHGCEIVTGDDVVRITGAAKLAVPASPNPRGCNYVLEMPGGAGEGYLLGFERAEMEALLLDHLTPEEKMEKVDGPWDQGFVGPQALGRGLRMLVVRRGDLGIEVSGDRREPLIEIAKLAAMRIK